MFFQPTDDGYGYRLVCSNCGWIDFPRHHTYDLLMSKVAHQYFVVEEKYFVCYKCLPVIGLRKSWRPFFKLPPQAQIYIERRPTDPLFPLSFVHTVLADQSGQNKQMNTKEYLRTITPFNFEDTWEEWYENAPLAIKEDAFNQADYEAMQMIKKKRMRIGAPFVFDKKDIPTAANSVQIVACSESFGPANYRVDFHWVPQHPIEIVDNSLQKICAITTPHMEFVPAIIRGGLRRYGDETRTVLPTLVNMDSNEPLHITIFRPVHTLTFHISQLSNADVQSAADAQSATAIASLA